MPTVAAPAPEQSKLGALIGANVRDIGILVTLLTVLYSLFTGAGTREGERRLWQGLRDGDAATLATAREEIHLACVLHRGKRE